MMDAVLTHSPWMLDFWSHNYWQPKESSQKGETLAHIMREKEKFFNDRQMGDYKVFMGEEVDTSY